MNTTTIVRMMPHDRLNFDLLYDRVMVTLVKQLKISSGDGHRHPFDKAAMGMIKRALSDK